MQIKDYANQLYQIYLNKGESAFGTEFTKLSNTLIYSNGDKKGQLVERSYLVRILEEVSNLENSDSEVKNLRARSRLEIMLQLLKQKISASNSQTSK